MAELDLDFQRIDGYAGLPVDVYEASTSVRGLNGWKREIDLLPKVVAAPVYDAAKDEAREREHERKEREADKLRRQWERAKAEGKPVSEEPPPAAAEEDEPDDMPIRFAASKSVQDRHLDIPSMVIKTRITVGGRLTALSSTARFASDEFFVDASLLPLLDHALGPRQEDKRETQASKLLRWTSMVGDVVDSGVLDLLTGGRFGSRGGQVQGWLSRAGNAARSAQSVAPPTSQPRPLWASLLQSMADTRRQTSAPFDWSSLATAFQRARTPQDPGAPAGWAPGMQEWAQAFAASPAALQATYPWLSYAQLVQGPPGIAAGSPWPGYPPYAVPVPPAPPASPAAGGSSSRSTNPLPRRR